MIPIVALVVLATLFIFVKPFIHKDGQIDNRDSSNGFQIIDKDFNKEMTLPYQEVSTYAVVKDNLYLTVADKGSESLGNKVIQYNRKSENIKTIFKTKFKIASVQHVIASDEWLSWVDSDDFGTYVNIYAMNLETKKIISITKENDDAVSNGFPTISGNYLSWISHDIKSNKSYVMLRNLNETKNQRISEIKYHNYENNDVSMLDNKILFTDRDNKKSYICTYDIEKKKLKKIPTKSKMIGWATFLNNKQIVYLSFAKDDEFSKNQLILYDIKNHSEKRFSNEKYMAVDYLTLDNKNNVFVSKKEKNVQYSVDGNSILKKDVEDYMDISNIFMSNGIYLINIEDSKSSGKLIIDSAFR